MTESTTAKITGKRGYDTAALAGIILLGALLYGHTHSAPWYMDDLRAIVENRSIQNLQTTLAEFFGASRGLADLTFALNYHFGKTAVFGYHLVNIAIHLVTSCLVYLLFKRVFPRSFVLALGGALIFTAHPLQTQAVTYIVQRMTSLAALFFFLALYLFVLFRESAGRQGIYRWASYAAALICGALAVMTKQNTAVLPLVLILFDRYFLQQEQPLGWKTLAGQTLPFAIIPLFLGVKNLVLPLLGGTGLDKIGGMPDLIHLQNLSPLNYLVTEFSVIWLYLRLLFVPYGQALDYDVPIVAELLTLQNLVAFFGIVLLFVVAFLLRRREPLVSAGVLWFFLGLAVESTIIPLDPVFEHRLYISMFGFALVIMAGFSKLSQRQATVGIILLVTVLSVLTWMRNDLWNDPLAFHEDNLRRAPRSERVHLDVGNIYLKRGRVNDAQQVFERALAINPGYVALHINLSRVYTMQKQYDKAVAILQEGLRRNPNHFRLYNNLGVLYNFMGQYQNAAITLEKGIALESYHGTVHFNLALAYDRLGHLDQAEAHYRRSIVLDDSDPMGYFNLGNLLHKQGKPREALQAYLQAARRAPDHAGILYNAGQIYLELGDPRAAADMAARLHRIDPRLSQQLNNRIQASQ